MQTASLSTQHSSLSTQHSALSIHARCLVLLIAATSIIAAEDAFAKPRPGITATTRHSALSTPHSALRSTEAPEVLLDGKPFPLLPAYEVSYADPKRTFYVAPAPGPDGKGSEKSPWRDLQEAVRRVEPGDRIVLLPGEYSKIAIDGRCKSGTKEAPIQLFAREGAILRSQEDGAVVNVSTAWWQFHGLTIIPGDHLAIGVRFQSVAAHDITFDRGVVHGGRNAGIQVGSSSFNIVVANSRIYDLTFDKHDPESKATGRPPVHGHYAAGIMVSPFAHDLTVAGNDIHNTDGPAVMLAGPHGRGKEMTSLIRNVVIRNNRLHDGEYSGVLVLGAMHVEILQNRIWGFHDASSRGRGQVGMLIKANVSHVKIVGNYVGDVASTVLLGQNVIDVTNMIPGKNQLRPVDVLIERNYFDNRKNAGGIGISAASGSRVRIYNNLIQGFPYGMLLLSPADGDSATSAANNLIVDASTLPLAVASTKGVRYLDHNFFSLRKEAGEVEIEGKRLPLASYITESMPHSRLLRDVSIGNDLASLGALLVNAGTPLKGIKFAGTAPDIGVMER